MTKNTTDTNQASEDGLGKTVHVDICTGASGECVYVNDYRVKGGKPWGGGTVTKSIEIKTAKLLRAIEPEIESLIRTEKLRLLATIGQPTLDDVSLMQPEQYEGGVIINDWYKNRLAELEAEL